MQRRVLLLATVVTGAYAFGGAPDHCEPAKKKKKIHVVVHGAVEGEGIVNNGHGGKSFWDMWAEGADAAAQDSGAEVTYARYHYDTALAVQGLETACNEADAIIVSVPFEPDTPEYKAVDASIHACVDEVPIVITNTDTYHNKAAVAYVGSANFQSGKECGLMAIFGRRLNRTYMVDIVQGRKEMPTYEEYIEDLEGVPPATEVHVVHSSAFSQNAGLQRRMEGLAKITNAYNVSVVFHSADDDGTSYPATHGEPVVIASLVEGVFEHYVEEQMLICDEAIHLPDALQTGQSPFTQGMSSMSTAIAVAKVGKDNWNATMGNAASAVKSSATAGLFRFEKLLNLPPDEFEEHKIPGRCVLHLAAYRDYLWDRKRLYNYRSKNNFKQWCVRYLYAKYLSEEHENEFLPRLDADQLGKVRSTAGLLRGTDDEDDKNATGRRALSTSHTTLHTSYHDLQNWGNSRFAKTNYGARGLKWGEVDWAPYISPAYNQIGGPSGCHDGCWAFTSAAALEAAFSITSGDPHRVLSTPEQWLIDRRLSMQQLMDCNRNLGGWKQYTTGNQHHYTAKDSGSLGYDCDGPKGGTFAGAFAYVAREGLTLKRNYETDYTNHECRGRAWNKGPAIKTSGQSCVSSGMSDPDFVEAMKRAVAHQPVAIAVESCRLMMDHDLLMPGTGVFKPFDTSCRYPGAKKPYVDHAVLIVGYGTEWAQGVATQYWKIRNTVGTYFGEAGHIRVKMSANAASMKMVDPCWPTGVQYA